MGRPGLAPGVYFRGLLVGYFEGISSERGIDWRCADSLALRSFLGVPWEKPTPDHSTLSRTRRLIDVETHQEVFGWMLKRLAEHGPARGPRRYPAHRPHRAGSHEAARAGPRRPRGAPGARRPDRAGSGQGYHSNQTLVNLEDVGVRGSISEPKRGRRNWKKKQRERNAVLSNRRRIKRQRGKALLRRRGELLERPFAHGLETGGLRRVHVRGNDNVLKRSLIVFAGVNISLRTLTGAGTPRSLHTSAENAARKGLSATLAAALRGLLTLLFTLFGPPHRSIAHPRHLRSPRHRTTRSPSGRPKSTPATGCQRAGFRSASSGAPGQGSDQTRPSPGSTISGREPRPGKPPRTGLRSWRWGGIFPLPRA